mgnify:CR=1 FL=1
MCIVEGGDDKMDKGMKLSASSVQKKDIPEQKLDSKEFKPEVLKTDAVKEESVKADAKAGSKKAETAKPVKETAVISNKEETVSVKKTEKEMKTETKEKVSETVKAAEPEKEAQVLAKENPKRKTSRKATARKAAAKPVTEKTVKPKKVVKKSEKAAKKKVPQMAVSTYIQYFGKEIEQGDLIKRVVENWTANGNDEKAIETLELYVKPEESRVYYVVNGIPCSGQIDI